MSPQVTIRPATLEDASAIGTLIADLAIESILVGSPLEARKHFLDANGPAAIVRFMGGSFRYYVADVPGNSSGSSAFTITRTCIISSFHVGVRAKVSGGACGNTH